MADDIVVVVPGITGSVLRRSGKELWGLSAATISYGLTHAAAALERLRLPEGIRDAAPEGPEQVQAPSLMMGVHLWPGFWAGTGYGQLLTALRRRCGERVVEFPYDWRLSNRHTARLLQDYLATKLGRWREKPGQQDAQIVFVCHSMGGLIARYYLDVLGGAEVTRRLITIGTPYQGSVKAVRALTGGIVPVLGHVDAALVDVARTFPAVHQLLPTYRCIDHPKHGSLALHDHPLPDLPTASVADSRAFHDELSRDDLDRSYEEHIFGGKNQPTDQSLSLTPTGIAFHRTLRGRDHLGDGTVPVFSSVPTHLRTTAAATYLAARHAKLQRHRSLLDLVIDKVEGLDLGAILAPRIELGLDMPDVVAAGDEVTIRITANRPDLFLHATITGLDGTMYDRGIPVEPRGDTTYTAQLRPPPGVWHVDIHTVNDPAPAQVGDLLLVSDPA